MNFKILNDRLIYELKLNIIDGLYKDTQMLGWIHGLTDIKLMSLIDIISEPLIHVCIYNIQMYIYKVN